MHPLDAPGALWVLSRAGKVPRPPAGGRNLPQEIHSLWKARERPSLLFPVSQRVSPLRRRPKGFPVALWKPSGPTLLKRMGIAKNGSLAEGKGKSLSCFPRIPKDFASAEATKGLSDRPLETFGPLLQVEICARNSFLAEGRKMPFSLFPYHKHFRLCGGDQGASPLAP